MSILLAVLLILFIVSGSVITGTLLFSTLSTPSGPERTGKIIVTSWIAAAVIAFLVLYFIHSHS